MSNIGPFGGGKNPPWSRGAIGNAPNLVGQANPLQQQMLNQNALSSMNATGMVQYQQPQQVFQSPLGLQQQNLNMSLQQMANNPVSMNAGLTSQIAPSQLFPQVGAVTYPNPRALNPTAFQTQTVAALQAVQGTGSNSSTKQRVFTGTVTKVHDTFGFVDEDVFFQTSACVKGSNPVVGDRVLVEATFNPNMPFKWNATRIQVLPMSGTLSNVRPGNTNNQKGYGGSGSSGYNAVPPPSDSSNGSYVSSSRNNQRKGSTRGRSRDRSRDRDRDDEEDRKKRREERARERDEKDKKSPLRRRSRSPKSRRRTRIVPRYMVQIPKISMDSFGADVLEVRRRYMNLYVPSDFFCSQFRWVDAFPPHSPFALSKPCSFHIMNKEVEPLAENPAVLEPSDADYLFSAKVMLISIPTMEEIYSKCCSMAEDKDKKDRDSEDRDFIHPTRLINFLVGLRGKNETMALGGPWSPSLDGPNPDKDPSVLIRTAIRTCRALTGIDLSNCTQWYRFLELYYRRGESTHKGRAVPARVETVVLFLPDVWSCLPTRIEWDGLHHSYRKQLERRLKADQDADEAAAADEKEEELPTEDKLEPTHYSQLDPKTMNVNALRTELKARSVNSKGLKSQLVARLTKALKAEAEKSEEDFTAQGSPDSTKADADEKDEKKKEKEAEEKKLDEKERAQLEKRYVLPEEQHIIVHPSRTAKSGKFDCTVMSLSLLLDYRPEDTKEHSFEVSLFAELFNEMLMRDFGFNIYKALYELPEKPKEDKKEEKKKKDDKKKEDKDDKKDDRKEDRGEEEDEDEEEDDEDDKKDRDKRKSTDKKKKDRPKLVTKDKNLLLSFVYFDQTHCGYIFEKDIEDLLYTLGLNLSRAQVRKLVSKVVTRDSLHYRKLTDKPKDDETPVEDDDKESNLEEIASGNKRLLPIFYGDLPPSKKARLDSDTGDANSSASEGMVMFQGALVDISKLMAQLKRSEKARIDTETRLGELKSENGRLLERNTKYQSTIKNLTSDLKDYRERLNTSDENLIRMAACSKLFHATLQEVKDKIEPVISTSLYVNLEKMKREDKYNHSDRRDDDKDSRRSRDDPAKTEHRKDSHESRWENSEHPDVKPEPADSTKQQEEPASKGVCT